MAAVLVRMRVQARALRSHSRTQMGSTAARVHSVQLLKRRPGPRRARAKVQLSSARMARTLVPMDAVLLQMLVQALAVLSHSPARTVCTPALARSALRLLLGQFLRRVTQHANLEKNLPPMDAARPRMRAQTLAHRNRNPVRMGYSRARVRVV